MNGTTFAPFQFRTFRLLWIASLITNLGWQIQSVAAGWLMASLSSSPATVALVQAAVTFPLAILSILGGVFADNYERRTVMILAQVFMLFMTISLAGLTWAALISPWALLVFTFAIGCGVAMHLPSWQASVGDLVPRKHLPQAVMLNGMGFNLMRSVGPAVGGAIVAAFGAAVSFAINAATYFPVLLALASWKPERTPNFLPPEPLGSALGAGLRYVILSPDHVKIMLRGAVFGFSAVAALALMPLVARQLLQGTAITFGLILTCFGAGAVTVALTLHRVREKVETETIIRVSFLFLATGLMATALSKNVWATGVAAGVTGMAWQSSMSLFNVATQLSTPRWVLGRAMSILQVFTFGGMTLGSVTWGRVATAAGLETALALASATCLLGAALGLMVRLPGENNDDLDPHGRFTPPDPDLQIDMQSGPIKVSVEFHIRPENTRAFLELMALRRRIRLRDGARSWSLNRDMSQPDLWHESYRVPTWAAYLRHMQRRTTKDAENYSHLADLHQGNEPPVARRWIERPADASQLLANK